MLYTSLQDQRVLIANSNPTAQLFGIYFMSICLRVILLLSLLSQGLWWTLHLLVSEAAGHYKRKDYASMLMDEGLLPRFLFLLASP